MDTTAAALDRLLPPRYSRLNNGPVGQEHDKEHLSQRSLNRVQKAIRAAVLSGVPLGGPKFSGSWFG